MRELNKIPFYSSFTLKTSSVWPFVNNGISIYLATGFENQEVVEKEKLKLPAILMM